MIDKTGLTGRYDFTVEFSLDLAELAPRSSGNGGPASIVSEGAGSDYASAMQQQTGLRLVEGKGMLDFVIVDKAEKVPTDN